jgi:hypothetical protein
MRIRWNVAFLVIAVFVAAFVIHSRRQSFDRKAWQADHLQLSIEVIRRYPDLAWTVTTGRLDPKKLYRATENALERATTNEEAERAIRTFVRAFRDRHFTVQEPGSYVPRRYEEPQRGRLDRATSPETLCRFLKFADEDSDFELPFERLRSFRRLPKSPANAFPAGMLTLDGRRIAILRIPSFDERDYLSTCLAGWKNRRRYLRSRCDGRCLYGFVKDMRNQLLADLAARVRQLEAERADVLLLDLTHNLGGFNWYEPAAAIFAEKGANGLRASMLRNEATVENLRQTGRWIRQDLGAHDLSDRETRLLRDSGARISALIQEARQPCTLAYKWFLSHTDAGCTQLITGDFFSSGLYASRPPGLRDSWLSADELFQASGYEYDEGVRTVPLAVLMDRRTASAAEHFAIALRTAAGALLIGDHTAGAGGGWMHGTAPLVLTHSRLEVAIPDHITWLPDGSNSVLGLDPDICVGWAAGDEPIIRLRKVVQALRRL